MSAQGKRHAAVVFVPLGACRRQQIVQRARSTVNQEGTCGTKMTGRIALRACCWTRAGCASRARIDSVLHKGLCLAARGWRDKNCYCCKPYSCTWINLRCFGGSSYFDNGGGSRCCWCLTCRWLLDGRGFLGLGRGRSITRSRCLAPSLDGSRCGRAPTSTCSWRLGGDGSWQHTRRLLLRFSLLHLRKMWQRPRQSRLRGSDLIAMSLHQPEHFA